ncbi:signal peptidase I [Phenylobacterium sp. SCN 70-31]|uniref:signal peptidase I n=1 Tax=Phenylobacterium sp. SCN 70-31 TaxID=1660129 RepID=UPI00086B4C05|nr:signal peptidase I [Phenylobacterium sp. SCN 70-31]ODT87154.1 MAG: signal peptidase I [Phenylobacterium sp. SCN 70-31]
MSQNVQGVETPEKSSALKELVEIVKTIVFALLIALVLRVIFFQPFTIPSASMEPNLYEGDYIIVSKYSYGWSKHSIPFSPPLFEGRIMERPVNRGDIAVFKLPSDGRTDYVKRILGLPGDRLQMRDGLLYINDKLIEREPLSPVRTDVGYGQIREVARYQERLPGGRTYVTQDFGTDGDLDNTDVYIVPDGHYFAIGDNRDNSLDSRVPPALNGVGYVPADHLVGKAEIILLSWKPEATIFKPWTWVLDARPSRFFKVLK